MKDVDDELTVNSGPYTIPKFLFANSHYSQTSIITDKGRLKGFPY